MVYKPVGIDENGKLPPRARGVLDASYVGNSPSGTDAARAMRDIAYRPFYAQLATGGSQVYILGHSVVAASGASTAANGFATLLKNSIINVDPTASVTIAGNPGYTSTQLLNKFASAGQNATFTSLTVFMGLLNDYSNGIDPATSKSNLLALVAKMKAIQPNGYPTPGFMLILEWLRNDVASPAYPWSAYVAAAKDVANGDPTVTLVDLGTRMGDVATDKNGFYQSDKVHPTDKGHAFIARAVISDLLTYTVTGSPARLHQPLIQIDPKIGGAVAATGTWALAVNANYLGNAVYYNNGNAQNDSVSFDVVLAPGTWAIDVMHSKNTNGGIITVSMDDGYGTFTTLGTIDTYAAAAAYNQTATIAGNAVGGIAPRKRRIQLQVTGRNASNTTGYYFNFQFLQLRKTA